MTKCVVIVGEGAGKIKEKLRETFRATEIGKDTMLFEEPSLVEEEKEFQRFMEMQRRFCEEVGVASVTSEKEITARQMAEAVERMRELHIKPVEPLKLRLQTQDEIAEMVDKGFLPMYEPVFEPRIIPYDPPPYKSFYDEYRMATLLGRFEAEQALVIKNLKICPKCGCPMQKTDTCPDCGNTEMEEKTDV